MHNTETADIVARGALDELVILGDFSRICDGPLWYLSEMYWRQVGSAAFTAGEVPYVVTNDGSHAGSSVDVFIASALAAREAGDLEDELLVLELGAGSGVFAKLFLDQLQDRCLRQGLDFHDRTQYIATDGSPGMLEDLIRTGVLRDHADRVTTLPLRLPHVDDALRAAETSGARLRGSVRAVFANYVLDSLPFTILCLEAGRIWELEVRSRIAEEDLARLELETGDGKLELESVSSDLDRLQAIQEALVLETRYVLRDRSELPCCESIIEPTDSGPKQFLHSFGAVEALQQISVLLRPDGYAQVTDYGYTTATELPDIFEPQTFGRSVACTVNFAQIEQQFSSGSDLMVAAPEADPENLQTRLLGRRISPSALETFRNLFSGKAWNDRNGPLSEATRLTEQGRFEAARWEYEKLLRRQPFSWSSHEAAAVFLMLYQEEHDTAISVARRGLQLNHLSSGLWNVLGDCHYAKGELEEAAACYDNALQVNPRDVRGRLNQAYVAVAGRRFADALRLIGEALALDRDGDFRQALLEKQTEAIDGLVHASAKGVLRGVNRMRGHNSLPSSGDGANTKPDLSILDINSEQSNGTDHGPGH